MIRFALHGGAGVIERANLSAENEAQFRNEMARICADEGNCARAVELLEEFEMAVPGEKSVKRFLGAMRQIGR